MNSNDYNDMVMIDNMYALCGRNYKMEIKLIPKRGAALRYAISNYRRVFA